MIIKTRTTTATAPHKINLFWKTKKNIMTCDSKIFMISIRTTDIHCIHWLLDKILEPLVAFIIFVSIEATSKTLVFTIFTNQGNNHTEVWDLLGNFRNKVIKSRRLSFSASILFIWWITELLNLKEKNSILSKPSELKKKY